MEVGNGPVKLGKAVRPILCAAYNNHQANILWLSLAAKVGFNAQVSDQNEGSKLEIEVADGILVLVFKLLNRLEATLEHV
jgi:hypothetical protein